MLVFEHLATIPFPIIRGKPSYIFFIVHYCAENGCTVLQWMVLCQPAFAVAYLCRTESKKASTL